jgi:hypothetical protein
MIPRINLSQLFIITVSIICLALSLKFAAQMLTKNTFDSRYAYTITRVANNQLAFYSGKELDAFKAFLNKELNIDSQYIHDVTITRKNVSNLDDAQFMVGMAEEVYLNTIEGTLIDALPELIGGKNTVVVNESFWQTHFSEQLLQNAPALKISGQAFVIAGILRSNKKAKGANAIDLWINPSARNLIFNASKPKALQDLFSYATPNRRVYFTTSQILDERLQQTVVDFLNKLPSSAGIYPVGEDDAIKLDFGITEFSSDLLEGIIFDVASYEKQQLATLFIILIASCLLVLTLIAFVFWEINRHLKYQRESLIRSIHGASFFDHIKEDLQLIAQLFMVPIVLSLIGFWLINSNLSAIKPFDQLANDSSVIAAMDFYALALAVHLLLIVLINLIIRATMYSDEFDDIRAGNLYFSKVVVVGVLTLIQLSVFIILHIIDIGSDLLDKKSIYGADNLIEVSISPKNKLSNQYIYELNGVAVLNAIDGVNNVGVSRLTLGESGWNRGDVKYRSTKRSNIIINEVNQGFFAVMNKGTNPIEFSPSSVVVSQAYCQLVNVLCDNLTGQTIEIDKAVYLVAGSVPDLAYGNFMADAQPSIYISHAKTGYTKARFTFYVQTDGSVNIEQLHKAASNNYPNARVAVNTLEQSFNTATATLSNVVTVISLLSFICIFIGLVVFYFFIHDSFKLTAHEFYVRIVHGASFKHILLSTQLAVSGYFVLSLLMSYWLFLQVKQTLQAILETPIHIEVAQLVTHSVILYSVLTMICVFLTKLFSSLEHTLETSE